MDNEQHSLAYEMLKEMKSSAKRWFIIALVELFIILTITGIFIWYISLPIEETSYSQEAEYTLESDVRQIIGDGYGQSETNKDN